MADAARELEIQTYEAERLNRVPKNRVAEVPGDRNQAHVEFTAPRPLTLKEKTSKAEDVIRNLELKCVRLENQLNSAGQRAEQVRLELLRAKEKFHHDLAGLQRQYQLLAEEVARLSLGGLMRGGDGGSACGE